MSVAGGAAKESICNAPFRRVPVHARRERGHSPPRAPVSVTAAEGFVAAGLHCGIKRKRKDLMLLATEDGRAVPAAAMFTTNKFCAAPVEVSRAQLLASRGRAVAVIVNSG